MEFEDISFDKNTEGNFIENLKIDKNYKEALSKGEYIDFTKIENKDNQELNKLVNFDKSNEEFQKLFYGECWNSRPKVFSELEYVTIDRKSFLQVKDTDINILKLFNLIGFNFNSENRIYNSSIVYKGKHFCNEKLYNYYVSIDVVYIVKLKRGGIKITNLEQLTAQINAKKVTAEYRLISQGIKVNPSSTVQPKFGKLSSGIFNEKIKIELDDKIEYLFNEISKEDGAFMAQPFPDDFNIYIKE